MRSRSMARSKSAKAPTLYIIIRPAGVVVLIASVNLRNPAPASPSCSMDREHVAQGAQQPVELPDNDYITGAELMEEPQKLGPVPTSAGNLLAEDALATRRSERST